MTAHPLDPRHVAAQTRSIELMRGQAVRAREQGRDSEADRLEEIAAAREALLEETE